MSLAEEIVNAIFRFLNDHSGFDHWWDDIEPETREEILEQMVLLVEDRIEQVEEEAWMYRDLTK